MLHMIQGLCSHYSMFLTEQSQSVTVSTLYHLRLSQLTCFTLSSDGSIFPASDIVSCAVPHTVYIWDVKATGFGSGLSKSVYRSISAITCSNMVPRAPVTVFRRKSAASLGHPGGGIRGSPTGLEDLTPDVLPLWVASGDEYPTLDDTKVGGL